MTAETIRETLRPLLRQARDEGKWLWCGYQSLWFSPDELDAQHDRERFLWGPENWVLRDPAVRIEQLEQSIGHAKADLAKFRRRMNVSSVSEPGEPDGSS